MSISCVEQLQRQVTSHFRVGFSQQANLASGEGAIVRASTRRHLEVVLLQGKMIAAQALLKEFGVLDVARTGRVAMPRDSGINTQLLNARRAPQVML